MNMIVFKIGGSIADDLPSSFYKKLVELKKSGDCHPVIVHGGGPGINKSLKEKGIESTFSNGLRVTTQEVLEVAEAELCGIMNKKIAAEITKAGGNGFGISGTDGSLLQVKPADPSGNLGFVGTVTDVNFKWLDLLAANGAIPVIAPVGIAADGQKYNINADTAAAAVAAKAGANIAFISNVPGVLEMNGESVIHHKQLNNDQIENLISNGVINGGMIPKVKAALNAVENGVEEAVILNGFEPESLTEYVNSGTAGTVICLEKEADYV